MNDPHLKFEKQEFIDYLNKFVSVIGMMKKDIINKNRIINLVNTKEERDEILFYLNCIEDSSNSLGCTLQQYDKSDIIKTIVFIMFHIYFYHDCRVMDSLFD